MLTPSSSRNRIKSVTPKLFDLIEKVAYDDVWERTELSKRDRSLITVAALVALCRPDQLRSHMERALANGVTKEEISETITHLAIYAGFPAAISAALIAKPLFESDAE